MTPSNLLLKDIGEDELIARLTKGLKLHSDVIAGAGDDCAVVKGLETGFYQLLKTDCVVEGVHFLTTTKPERVGWKAMARVVSDIASMAGIPQFAMVTLLLPPTLEVEYVEAIYKGLSHCAENYGVSIVGGETSRGSCIVISVSLTGKVSISNCLRRDGAQHGDAIYVTGQLGGSINGHHLDFQPRVEQAHWLAANFAIHSMMDLSDGLQKDLPRMAKASGGLGFELIQQSLPLNAGCTIDQALNDGEDYELLFALSASDTTNLEQAWAEKFPYLELTRIGSFTEVEQGRQTLETKGGWDHFAS